MSALRLLRQSERSWPAEHSIALRAVAAGAVCVAIAACAAQGELPVWYAAVASGLVGAGSLLSYRRRTRPLPHLKILLGAVILGAFAWFVFTVSADATTGQLSAVEAPLAALFSAMQATHAFDMPSRRDVGFSLAGSAGLMAIAGSQAVDLAFGVYVVLWAALAVAGLHECWSSMAGGAPPRPVPVVASTVCVLAVAVLLVAFLPAPRLPSVSGASSFGGTAGAGGSTTVQPARLVPAPRTAGQEPASASGPTGVGGFLGFAGPLDTALRPGLGDEVVLRVRADRPTYWVAETFDSWSGRSWTETGQTNAAARDGAGGARQLGAAVLTGGPPFLVAPNVSAHARADYQTFYLAASASNLVLHADQADAVWIPARRLYVGEDDTIRLDKALGAGSVYSVESTVETPSVAELARSNGVTGLTAAVLREELQLPHPYPRVAALARRVTAHDPTVISKVVALEQWMGAHTRYTLDIPPLAPGQDTVDEFLFGTRRGYCEQISTSLAVMLRTLGIPAREAVGYVPGTFDPITGLYDEQAKDAHAWVQVWFPGFGWQSFDPTAYVPLANPSPASTIGHEIVAALGRVPLVPTLPLAALLVLAALALVWRRQRPPTWHARVTRELERATRRAGLRAEPGATLCSLASALDAELGGADASATAHELATAAAAAAWGGDGAPAGARRNYVHEARRIRRAARRHTRRRRLVAAVHPSAARRRAASAKLAPATRSGRNAISWRGRDTASTPVNRSSRP